MKIDIFNIDEFVKVNHCPEVTNPICWSYDGNPTTDGIFSYELFGFSDDERKNTFGYIDLKNYYIHPLPYILIMSRMGSLGKILTGEKYAVIADKKIKIVDENFPNAETGVKFIYDHFEEIDWINEVEEKEMDSIDKRNRLKFFKMLSKDEFFIRKWLVLPPFYRAESSENKSMGDNINKLYKELLSRVKSMNLGFSFNIFNDVSQSRIQNILRDIYLCTTAPISGKNLILEKGKLEGKLAGVGKNSMLRRHLLGKTIDWAHSSVITSPNTSLAKTLKDMPTPYGYGRFPLAGLISMFQPFYVSWCVDRMETIVREFAIIFQSQIKRIDVGQYNAPAVEKLLTRFVKSPNDRFEPIVIEYTTPDNKKISRGIALYEFKTEKDFNNHENFIMRPMTLTDLIFQASIEILKDKHVYVTRFPITNFQNIYPSKIIIASTNKTQDKYISLITPDSSILTKSNSFFKDYPLIPLNKDKMTADNRFFDVFVSGNHPIKSLNADYDGDMLYMRGVFTQEANVEAEKLIKSKTNFFDVTGRLSRRLSNLSKEVILGTYELTK